MYKSFLLSLIIIWLKSDLFCVIPSDPKSEVIPGEKKNNKKISNSNINIIKVILSESKNLIYIKQ